MPTGIHPGFRGCRRELQTSEACSVQVCQQINGVSGLRGYLREMSHEVARPIEYSWAFDDGQTARVNDWLGKSVRIQFLGQKRCVHCGRSVTKLYQAGYCFPCVTTLAETDLCIVKPEICHFHLGTCRDDQYGESHCMIPHYVYLAVSSQVKVGLTRKHRELTRWMDQGAVGGLLFAEVPNRKAAGELEVEIARELPDKTDWRKLITGVVAQVDLEALATIVAARLPEQWQRYLIEQRTVHHLSYPTFDPERIGKAKSHSLDKSPVIEGTLIAIRGQYLIFDHGAVQIRKHAGFLCDITVE